MRRILAVLIFAASIAGQACAVEIDFGQTMRDMDGKPFVDEKGQPIKKTLGQYCEAALLGMYADEGGLAGTEKFARWQLAQKIHGKDKVDLSVEEIARIKVLVGKAFAAGFVGPAWLMLDPATK